MRKYKIIFLLFLLFLSLTGCSIGETDGLDYNFSNENEYVTDEFLASLSPVEMVVFNWTQKRLNNAVLWKRTLTERFREGQPDEIDFAILELDMYRIYEATGKHREECLRIMNTYEHFKSINDDDLTVVFMVFDILYDNTKVVYDSRLTSLHYVLIRNNENKIWELDDGGQGVYTDIYDVVEPIREYGHE